MVRPTGGSSFHRLLLAAVAAFASACATLSLPNRPLRSMEVGAGDARFIITFEPRDDDAAREVAAVIPSVLAHLDRWGTFEAPVTLRIHPSHRALEEAVGRIGYPWLRAWARYDTVDLQSPSSWNLQGASPAQVGELLTHELTHCLMYQRTGTPVTWIYKRIPLWFREGMASVTADQGYRRETAQHLSAYLHQHPGRDPLSDAEAMYQDEPDIVYGSAHRAFEFLVLRYGEGAVREVLVGLSRGEDFSAALRRTTSLGEEQLVREFLRYLRWEGWRPAPEAPPNSSPAPLPGIPIASPLPRASEGELGQGCPRRSRSESRTSSSSSSADSSDASISGGTSISEPVSPSGAVSYSAPGRPTASPRLTPTAPPLSSPALALAPPTLASSSLAIESPPASGSTSGRRSESESASSPLGPRSMAVRGRGS